MKISFHPLLLPVVLPSKSLDFVLSHPMSGWNFPPASMTGLAAVFPRPPNPFFPHSIPGPSQKRQIARFRTFPSNHTVSGKVYAEKSLASPGRNETLRLFCGESFYMSPQGFRSATWSPTIPLRKIAFCLSVPQISTARIAGSVSELRIDKLLGRAPRNPAVPQLELVCAPQQLFLRKRYTVALGERQYNLVIGPARRFVVPD